MAKIAEAEVAQAKSKYDWLLRLSVKCPLQPGVDEDTNRAFKAFRAISDAYAAQEVLAKSPYFARQAHVASIPYSTKESAEAGNRLWARDVALPGNFKY